MFLSPKDDVLEFGFMPGQSVADLGAGTGYYALSLARILGKDSHVVAVDLQTEPLVRLKKVAEREGLSNLEVLHGDIDNPYGTHLKSDTFDGVLLSNVLFQIDNQSTCIQESERILKKRGRLVIIEWSGKLSQEKIKEMCADKGLSFERSFNVGDHHCILIFKK